MSKDELYEQLEAYLDGKLPAQEVAQLRIRIATEEEVAEQLAMLRLERELAGLMMDQELEGLMEDWQTETSLPKSVEKASIIAQYRLWLIILIVFASLGFVLMVLYPFPWYSLEDTPALPAQDRQEQPSPPTQRPIEKKKSLPPTKLPPPPIAKALPSRAQTIAIAKANQLAPLRDLGLQGEFRGPAEDTASLSNFERGYAYLTIGRLKEAATTLAQITTESEAFESAQFYLALVHIETQAYDKAIPVLEALLRDASIIEQERLEWYLALAYCTTGQLAAGQKMLVRLANQPHPYRAEAADLLEAF